MESAKFSPRAKSKKKLVCAVEGCNSTSNKDMDIRFHYFPMKTNRTVYIKIPIQTRNIRIFCDEDVMKNSVCISCQT